MQVTLCVDALEPQPGGIGRYTWQLCKGLAQHPAVTKLNYFARGQIVSDPAALLAGRKPARLRGIRRYLRKRQTRQVLQGSLVHGPNYFLPPSVESGVITVHDLSVLRFPETHPVERVRAFEKGFSDVLGRASHIITDTETVRQELIREFSIRPDHVSAVWLGVDDRFSPRLASQLQPELDRFGLAAGGYGLCVSTLEPRKKIMELLAAWRRLPPALRSRTPLVLAGGSGWRSEGLREQVAAAEREGWLRHLGFVDEAALPALYAGAALFIYPSVYEGFGLPPVEAMASGVPVIVSGRSCLPEVCGEAAQYVDPDDVEQFALCIDECLTDQQLRARLIKTGLTRAGLFDWERCIEGTVLAYKRAVG